MVDKTTGAIVAPVSASTFKSGNTIGGGAPEAHAASHASAGSDAVTLAQSQVTNLTSDLAAKQPLATVLTNTTASFTAAQETKLAGVATGATANSSDATLLARANHTGTQSADTLTDGTTNKAFLATERTKLAGIATGATANSADATLLARANHTGTQAQSTVTDLVSDLAGKQPLATVLTNTTAAFTTAQETKLAGIETGAQANVALASQAEAEAGTEATKTMTAVRVAQAIAALATGGGTSEGTSTATGTQNDFAHSNVTLLRMNNATPVTITGFVAGTAGQLLHVVSVGAGQVNFANQSASSSEANRIINPATGTISLAAGSGAATLQYDDTTDRWRVIEHMQGAVIQTTYNAGNFTASGSMTWTVEAGDHKTYTYYLKGKLLQVFLQFDSTAIGGTPSIAVQVAIPGGFTAAWDQVVPCFVIDAGTPAIGYAQVVATGTTIYIYRSPAAPNWSASASDCSVRVAMTIAVQ